MNSTSRVVGNSKPLFSVFSDESATSSKPSSSSSQKATLSSTSLLPVASTNKRVKMTASLSDKKPVSSLYGASSSKTGLPMLSSKQPRTALSTKKIAVFHDDKENIDPTGKKRSSLTGKDKLSSKSDSSAPPKADLWKGKQPFDFASPEKEDYQPTRKNVSSSIYIYDMLGIEANNNSHVTAAIVSSTKIAKPSSLRTVSAGGAAVSRPNKKVRAIPAPLKKTGTFEIFKDDADARAEEVFVAPRTKTASSSHAPIASVSHLGTATMTSISTMRSPISLVKDSDRKARELTESPLADVTLAYTGRGRFSNSPTADSGFGSRETSVSPLPSARLLGASSSNLSLSPLQAYQELPAEDLTSFQPQPQPTSHDSLELPNALQKLSISSSIKALDNRASSPKRRISEVSCGSQSGRRPASTDCKEGTRHVNEGRDAGLDDFAMEHFGDVAHTSEDEEESESEDEQDDDVPPARNGPSAFFLPSQNKVHSQPPQARFGVRTSAPVRKPMNLRI